MEVMGSTGCNSFTGAIAMDTNRIEFINLVATEKACKGIGEPTFIDAMKSVTTFSMVDSNAFSTGVLDVVAGKLKNFLLFIDCHA